MIKNSITYKLTKIGSVPILAILIIAGLISSCASRNRFNYVELKMNPKQVQKIVGPPDLISTKKNDDVLYTYKKRLIDGFRRLKADYYVLFSKEKNGHYLVSKVFHGRRFPRRLPRPADQNGFSPKTNTKDPYGRMNPYKAGIPLEPAPYDPPPPPSGTSDFGF